MNTSSTADISFMLLIFFLVTTSMGGEKGLGRQMPPIAPLEQEATQDIDRELVMTLHLQKDGRITVNDREADIDDALRRTIRRFIIEKGQRHIIEVQTDRDADYDSYFRLQNHIIRTYNDVRNAAAMKRYGKTMAKCTEDEREGIKKAYPQRIKDVANAEQFTSNAQ